MSTKTAIFAMKNIIILTVLAAIASCTQTRTPELMKAELETYRSELSELSSKIAELEAELKTVEDTTIITGVKVVLAEIKTEPFSHYFRTGATAKAVQTAYISPEMGGQIQKIYVTEGQRVKKGEMLISLNAGPIQGQIAELRTALELATTIYNKQKELWEQKIGSEIQFIEAKTNRQSMEQRLNTAQVQYSMSLIKAPFDGIVDDIIGKVGEMSSPGMEVVRMVNLSSIEITAEISESYLDNIRKGDKVTVYFPSLGSKKVEARVNRIGNIINPANRTFKLIVKLENLQEDIKPNMVAVIEIKDYENPKAIALPSELIKSDVSGKTFVYIAQEAEGKLRAQKVFVTAGISYLAKTEVVEGLTVGDKYITDGFSTVSSGTEIQSVQQ